MANLLDGGAIVIGVEEKTPGKFSKSGMTTQDLKAYSQDQLQSDVNLFADPYVDLLVSTHESPKGTEFVIIQVRPFDTIPVICKRDGLEGLRNGALYTRARKKHETIEVPSQTEMREIVERAVRLGLKAYMETSVSAGLITFATPAADDSAKFDEQLGGL
jgi:hypothetical protein